VTLTVTDDSGNSAIGTAIVTVEDNAPPAVNTQDITVSLDANGSATIEVSDVLETGYGVSETSPASAPYPMAGTSMASVENCDDCTESAPIGFTFEFYGVEYTTVYVSSNGTVSFEDGDDWCCSGDPITSYDEPLIAVMNTDLDPGDDDPWIGYQTLGDAPNRVFVLSYQDVPNYDDTSELHDAQLVLEEATGNIIVYYGGHSEMI
jgi:hypothetical protein